MKRTTDEMVEECDDHSDLDSDDEDEQIIVKRHCEAMCAATFFQDLVFFRTKPQQQAIDMFEPNYDTCVNDFEKIDLFSKIFDIIEPSVSLKEKKINNEEKPYMSRAEKTAKKGHDGYLNHVDVDQLTQNQEVIDEYLNTYGVDNVDLELYKTHMDIADIGLATVALSIDDVIGGNQIPTEKFVHVPTFEEFYKNLTKIDYDVNTKNYTLDPFIATYILYGNYKNGLFFKSQPLFYTVNLTNPDEYALFHGLTAYEFKIFCKGGVFTSNVLYAFYIAFLKTARLDNGLHRQRHIMKVMEAPLKQLYLTPMKEKVNFPEMYVKNKDDTILDYMEKNFIAVSQLRVLHGEAARINMPSALSGFNDKHIHMPSCTKEHQHLVLVVGGGTFESLMFKRLTNYYKNGDEIHSVDISYLGSGEVTLANGVSVKYYNNDIIDFKMEHEYCSVYSDITREDPNQYVMTNDYIYTNTITYILHVKILEKKITPICYFMLGLVRNLPDIPCNSVQIYSSSPEIFVIIDSQQTQFKSLYLFIPEIFASKMQYNNTYINNFKKGNITIPQGQRIHFDDLVFTPPMLRPQNKRYVPYSKSLCINRLVVNSKRYYDNRDVIIPNQYLDAWEQYVTIRDINAAEKFLAKLPVEIALIFDMKGKKDHHVISSKIRSTFGIKYGNFKPTLQQIQMLLKHPQFVTQKEIKGKKTWTLTLGTSTTLLLNADIINAIYKARHEY